MIARRNPVVRRRTEDRFMDGIEGMVAVRADVKIQAELAAGRKKMAIASPPFDRPKIFRRGGINLRDRDRLANAQVAETFTERPGIAGRLPDNKSSGLPLLQHRRGGTR